MTDSTAGSISECFEQLIEGDDDAIQSLWNRYFDQLLRVAKTRIGNVPRRAFDEEDVVLSVFECLRKGAQDGRFDEMRDRTELWKLLVTMTQQKAIDRIRRELAGKRGGGTTVGESALGDLNQSRPYGINELFINEPTPESLVSMEEEKNRLMSLLRDGSLRQVAVLRLEGFNQREIAEKLNVTTRTVERKLDLIRKAWKKQLEGNRNI